MYVWWIIKSSWYFVRLLGTLQPGQHLLSYDANIRAFECSRLGAVGVWQVLEIDLGDGWALYLVPANSDSLRKSGDGSSAQLWAYIHEKKTLHHIKGFLLKCSGPVIVLDLDGTILDQKTVKHLAFRPNWQYVRDKHLAPTDEPPWKVYVCSRCTEPLLSQVWDQGKGNVKAAKIQYTPSGPLRAGELFESKALTMGESSLLDHPAEVAFTLIVDDQKYNYAHDGEHAGKVIEGMEKLNWADIDQKYVHKITPFQARIARVDERQKSKHYHDHFECFGGSAHDNRRRESCRYDGMGKTCPAFRREVCEWGDTHLLDIFDACVVANRNMRKTLSLLGKDIVGNAKVVHNVRNFVDYFNDDVSDVLNIV
jgi:hypothetical protein